MARVRALCAHGLAAVLLALIAAPVHGDVSVKLQSVERKARPGHCVTLDCRTDSRNLHDVLRVRLTASSPCR
jgi:hypothetical protein